jgi:pyruvate formate lyase activating enzyme
MIFNRSECIGCLECVRVCHNKATSVEDDGRMAIDRRKCRLCGACIDICPAKARKLSAQTYTVDQLLKEIIKDNVFFSQTGGGITFSGGEPTIHAEFLMAVLKRCNDLKIHTAIETCGYVEWHVLERLCSLLDLVLYDVKMIDSGRHKTWTGVDNRLILNNLRALAAAGKYVIVRIPLIPGVNDDEEEFGNIVRFCRDLGTIDTLHILPFHQLGSSKYESLDRKYKFAGEAEQSKQVVDRCVQIAKSQGFFISIGGAEYRERKKELSGGNKPIYLIYRF